MTGRRRHMKLEEQMLLLESTLSTLSGYKGWVIGKCSFFLPKESEPEGTDWTCRAQVIRENDRLADIGILQGKTERLRVSLVKPAEICAGMTKSAERSSDRKSGDSAEKAGYADKNQKISEKFLVTREETDRYLAISGDKNPIHDGENAIVPGFLMVNRIAGMLEDPDRLRVRFFTPLLIGESAELVVRERNENGQIAEVLRNGERILKIEVDRSAGH